MTTGISAGIFSAGRFVNRAFLKLIVGIYKLVGIVILSGVVLGLVGYIGLHAFFFLHHGWAIPTIISPSDPRVLDLRARLVSEGALRDRLWAEFSEVKMQQEIMLQRVEFKRGLEVDLRRALDDETQTRGRDQERLRALIASHKYAERKIEASLRTFSDTNKQQLDAKFKAQMIDAQERAKADYQAAQVSQSNLTLMGQQAELQGRLASISTEFDALKQVQAPTADRAGGSLTFAAVGMRRELDETQLDLRAAQLQHEALQTREAALQSGLTRYDSLIESISNTTLLRAANEQLMLAFVPYDNFGRARPDAPVFGCRIGPLWCREVGHVVEVLPTELTGRHPLYGTELRGQAVELRFDDAADARYSVVHMGRAPLGW